MKVLSLLLALLGLFAFASAVDVLKSVIVSYPMSTPDHIVDQAKQAIEDAGGQITHNYQFIKGFAAKCGEKVLDSVTAWGAPYNAVIEEDQLVSALT